MQLASVQRLPHGLDRNRQLADLVSQPEGNQRQPAQNQPGREADLQIGARDYAQNDETIHFRPCYFTFVSVIIHLFVKSSSIFY
jgi:hypothetical protein